MSYAYTTSPATTPVSLTEVKAHLRIDGTDEDTVLTALMNAAIDAAENYMNRPIIVRTVKEFYDCFEDRMILGRAKAQTVDEILYTDTDGVSQSLSTSVYTYDLLSELGSVLLAYEQTWPSTANMPLPVLVEYTAGWSTAADVPASIKHAILLMVGEWYCCREDSVRSLPSASEYLMNPHRIWRFKGPNVSV